MRVVNIIPTYNEGKNIGLMLKTLAKIAKENKKYDFLHLVVDANSKDKTQQVVKDWMKKNKKVFLLTGPKRGLGHDLIRGYRYAMKELKAEVVIPNDADFQWDPKHIPDLLKKIDEGYDVVVASRHAEGGGATEKWSWFRKLNHWLANDFFAGIVAGVREVKDHTGCFKAIRVRGHLDQVKLGELNVKGFVIQNDILYYLSKTGAKFAEVPVKFKERKKGVSKVGFNKQYVKDIFEWIKACILIRLDRSRRFFRFAIVGFIGYLVNALGLEIFYRLGLPPGPSAALGAEMAIISNFTLNNLWTFAEKKITGLGKIIWKFFQFNLTSLGAVLIQGVIVGLLASFFGDQWRQVYLVIAIGFFVIPYNYTMYNVFIWKTWKVPFLSKLLKKN
jgi:dolichol-phosphate mannosyltransferase